jgi:hypothetical protein
MTTFHTLSGYNVATTISVPAINFDPGPEQWTIDQGAIAGATGIFGDGVDSSSDQSTLDNKGVVFSTQSDGVDFNSSSSNGFIQNFSGAIISGSNDGILVNGNGETINNSGEIVETDPFGIAGILFGIDSRNDQLTNQGNVIAKGGTGVSVDSLFDGGIIDNFGSISGNIYGIAIGDAAGNLTHVTNAKGATIAGGLHAIFEVHGSLDLFNAGTINGNVFLDYLGSTDTITNNGKISGTVTLDGAVETFKGTKGTSGDIVTGAGNDTVLLGKGHVSVHIFEPAISHLTAGKGHDTFIFDNGFGGKAVIKHFSASVDKIELKETFFPGLGAPGTLKPSHFGIDHDVHNTNPQIVYNDHNGLLYYDANGDLPGGLSPFAKLVGDPPISNFTILLEP